MLSICFLFFLKISNSCLDFFISVFLNAYFCTFVVLLTFYLVTNSFTKQITKIFIYDRKLCFANTRITDFFFSLEVWWPRAMSSVLVVLYHHKPVLNPFHTPGSTPDFLSPIGKCSQVLDVMDSGSISILAVKTVDAAEGKLATLSLQARTVIQFTKGLGLNPGLLTPCQNSFLFSLCSLCSVFTFKVLYSFFKLNAAKTQHIFGSLQLCVITKQSISPLERNSITCSVKGSQLLLTGSLAATKHSSLLLYFIINLLMLTNILYIIQSTLINKTDRRRRTQRQRS